MTTSVSEQVQEKEKREEKSTVLVTGTPNFSKREVLYNVDVWSDKIESIKQCLWKKVLSSMSMVKKNEIVDVPINVSNIIFTHNGRALDQNQKTLSYYQIFGKKIIMAFKFRVSGGMMGIQNNGDDGDDDDDLLIEKDKEGQQTPNGIRVADLSHPLIKLSKTPDCLGLDYEGEENIFMPCRHSFSPSCLFEFLTSEITNRRVPIKCPMKCNAEWSFSILQCATGMSLEEGAQYHTDLEKLSTDKNLKECPVCKIGWFKLEGTDQVRCPNALCSSSDFCFKCLQPWHPSSACKELEERNRCLQNCDYVLVPGESILTPRVRACPSCQLILEYIDQCKHMTCPFCKHEFCLVCLKPFKSLHPPCKPHPKQRLPL